MLNYKKREYVNGVEVMLERWQLVNVRNGLKTRRVVLIVGARQCGKTTLAKYFCQETGVYLTLDDPTLLAAAHNDPLDFVKPTAYPMVIDEIQRVPALLSAIKKVVDEDTQPGQFLITGSADVQSLPTTQESLAGRIKKVRLRPLCQGEIQGRPPAFLGNMFADTLPTIVYNCDKGNVLERIFKGGYPEALSLNLKEQKLWYLDYVQSILDRDLRDISKIAHQDRLPQLLHSLAAWSSKLLDITKLSSGLALARPTIEHYMNLMELTFLVERVDPWAKGDYTRLGKSRKIIMTDTGMMCALLNLSLDKVRVDSDRLGKLFETFVFHELSAHIEANPGTYSLFHYRDRDNHEIDYLIEGEDGALLGVEVKASSTVGLEDFKHLKWFQSKASTPFKGIVIYTGKHVLSFGENLKAVPISALWE